MDYSSLHSHTVAELRKIAREMQVKLPAGINKENIIQTLLLVEKEREAQPVLAPAEAAPKKPARGQPKKEAAKAETPAAKPKAQAEKTAPAREKRLPPAPSSAT